MKLSTRILLLALLVGGAFRLSAADGDRWETLKAINLIENPTNSSRPGRHGELGPYQFRRTTWRMHTGRSFQLALDRDHADEIAVAHYEWIKAGLAEAGVPATTYNIAMAWNAGLTAVVSGRAPRVSRNYAQRVSNVVADLKSRDAAGLAMATVNPPSVSTNAAVYITPMIDLH